MGGFSLPHPHTPIQLSRCTFEIMSCTVDLALILELVESGKLKPVIDRQYRLREVPEALRYLGEGHAKGKVVITVYQESKT